ncbi:MAG TPA: hypothetical protein PKK06_09515 [Phycisphaerae bacterium]|nr:hypothetical protein [Phycisphaerae bacterium]HNU45537.1 hypothetical protein [Phycisphaerae bacterium]
MKKSGSQAALWLLGGVLLVAGLAVGEPGEQPRGVSSSWQLEFAFEDPQRISVKLSGDGEETTYWYMLYVVTNKTGTDVRFFPSFDLVTDTLQVIEGGANVHPAVYDAIAARHKKDYPFFAPPWKVTGPLLQGTDNARTSAVVFTTFDPLANRFTVYASGLSGELKRVQNPGFDPAQPESDQNPRFFILRRTLGITYELPGDPETRKGAQPVRRTREWVMR